MKDQCFYCANSLEENYHHGIFTIADEQVDKPLCPDCYKDWLEGIKE
ncbi:MULTISPECIES: hypothetical protein [unclassified Bacillus (in: firmicutes)]|nr:MULTISPECIES: hypothetical protein [unclassified Bacillus (in: firmicutes)]MBT2639904.1 hypothetical protein [Bacillus sp. ISL-39]MBT2663625.1 hypothetical protein [Bacillus sp. ISL-45]